MQCCTAIRTHGLAYFVAMEHVARKALLDELLAELLPQLLFTATASISQPMKETQRDGVDLVLDRIQLPIVGRGRHSPSLGWVVQLHRIEENVDIGFLISELGAHQGDHVPLATVRLAPVLCYRHAVVATAGIAAATIFLEYGFELFEREVAVFDDRRQLARVDAALLLLCVEEAVRILRLDAQVLEDRVQASYNRRDLGKVWARSPHAPAQGPRRGVDSFDGGSGRASCRRHACLRYRVG